MFILNGLAEIGRMAEFALEAFRSAWRLGVRRDGWLDQMYAAGVRSIPTTIAAGAFVGAILAMQLNLQLRDYGAQGVLGGLSVSTTVRNIGPVLIAFMLSARVGAFTAAELGTMRVTSQIDAIRCLGADPMSQIVVPRLIAVICASFCLLIIGLGVATAGGILVADFALGVNPVAFVAQIPRFVSAWSVGTGMVKSIVFGLLIGIVCCYRGYTASGGAAGVGRAVRRTAVEILVAIIVTDYLLSSLSQGLYDLTGMGEL